MPRRTLLVLGLMLALAACAPAETEAAAVAPAAASETPAPAPTSTNTPEPTPFPVDADGNFSGAPQDFLLAEGVIGSEYAAQDAGSQSPNSRVIELRADGEAYVAATGRLDGWQRQYNGEGQDPSYVIQVVNTYASAEGAGLVLSREWHSEVWDRIDDGTLELLPGISGLGVEHLVWQDAQGTVAVELVYRNLYIFFTGPSNGADNYDFFAELARSYLDWIRSHEG